MSVSGPSATDWRLAVDIGGTFTDVVLLDAASGRVVVGKTLTTPAAPLDGVRTGVAELLAKAGVRPGEITAPIVHATTLITNALIEGKTGRAALVTTDWASATRCSSATSTATTCTTCRSSSLRRPCPRDRTFELDERTMADGRVRRHAVGVRHGRAGGAGVRGRGRGGRRLPAQLVRQPGQRAGGGRSPAAPPRRAGVHLGRGVAADPRVPADDHDGLQRRHHARDRAVPRRAAEVAGRRGLRRLGADDAVERRGGLGGRRGTGARSASSSPGPPPVRWPARGSPASSASDRLLCFDMGGTTAKSCLVKDFEPELTTTFEVARMYRFKKGSGFPVSVPSVDLVEIGAGGGSLARIDELGLLKVGPESSGAEPGPASYGRGGTRAGGHRRRRAARSARPRLLPRRRHAARRRRAATAALAPIAAALGLAADDTAAGVHDVVNQNMAAASRMHAVEQGVDLRGVAVIAFGGAGPVHACGLAELLDSDRVIFPVNASVLSAFGTLVTPVRIDLARSMVRRLDGHRRGRAGRRAGRAADRGPACPGRGRRAPASGALPLRRRRPLHRPGQRDHGLGRRGRALAGRRRTTWRGGSTRSTSASTA